MPRSKRGGKRGVYSGGAYRGALSSNNHYNQSHMEIPFAPFQGTASARRNQTGFSLQDEARNTERHPSFWNTDQRLRNAKVAFVSAGSIDSTRPKDTEDFLAAMTLDSPEDIKTIEVLEEVDEDLGQDEISMQNDDGELSNPPDPVSGFVVDIEGSSLIRTGLPPPRLRSVSPAPSDSSEEVIIFSGRNRQGKGFPGNTNTSRTISDPIEQKIRMVEDEIHKREELLEEVLRQSGPSVVIDKPSSRKEPERPNQSRSHKGHTKDSEDAAIIADYIANIDKDDQVYQTFINRELGGTEDEMWQDTDVSSGNPFHKSRQALRGDWDPSDICDFDNLSTSDGVIGDIQEILSKRHRASGVQYLVVGEDQAVDEARWVPSTILTSINALSLIQSFKAEKKFIAEFVDNEESDTSSDIDNDSVPDEDDEDPEAQKTERMSDEQIARLLSKQEELGMGSDRLMLFDDGDDDDEYPVPYPRKFSPILLSSKKSPGKSRAVKPPRGEFPSATMLADAYGGFDVMDFDRPSLQKKQKGRKGKLVVNVSDSELEASMGAAWENDRLKKKGRKQEREELRARGLLGSKKEKPDLKQKYKEGMGIEAIREEIKEFLMGDNTTLSLPPMDKSKRKVVHEWANAFKLKSKSAGDGSSRFPILYKTARTSDFAEHTFNAVETRLTRRFLPRMDVGGKRSGLKQTGRGGEFNNAGVTYRDGDIVGGSAPELGAENRGRAILEKMGWSSGTALGAINNKGILQPVSHVVKTTKAGLG